MAKRHTATGALAFAIYYFRAFDWGLATNDTRLVQEISARGCRGCARFIRSLNRLSRSHATLLGGRLTFDSASIVHGRLRVRAEYAVDVSVNQEPVRIQSPGALPSTAAPADRHDHSLVFVDWIRGAWKVVEVTAK